MYHIYICTIYIICTIYTILKTHFSFILRLAASGSQKKTIIVSLNTIKGLLFVMEVLHVFFEERYDFSNIYIKVSFRGLTSAPINACVSFP
jgi:hypothetical protein